LSLFGLTDRERTWSFSMFLAGLFAGENCGQVAGSILAESLGYRAVLLISAMSLLVSGLLGALLKNDRLKAAGSGEGSLPERPGPGAPGGRAGSSRAILEMAVFLVLLLVPAGIGESYSSYFLPIYLTGLGRSLADVGRVLLLYSIIMVFGGPKIAGFFQKRMSSLPVPNAIYNGVIAAALILTGLGGGIGHILVAMTILGLADSFGFDAQKTAFLKLPLVARLSRSRGLSWYSFLSKLAGVLGPMVFALGISGGNGGIVRMGGFFFLAALGAFLFFRFFSKI